MIVLVAKTYPVKKLYPQPIELEHTPLKKQK